MRCLFFVFFCMLFGVGKCVQRVVFLYVACCLLFVVCRVGRCALFVVRSLLFVRCCALFVVCCLCGRDRALCVVLWCVTRCVISVVYDALFFCYLLFVVLCVVGCLLVVICRLSCVACYVCVHCSSVLLSAV